MKILFFGDKSVGNGILEYLKTTDDVIGIVTNKHDEETTWFPKVKGYWTTGKELPKFKSFDWIVCAYYDEILPDEIINSAKIGAINIHLGLVQDYRGCYPTTFPIIDGKKEAGVTIHKLTSKIDGGDVYIQAKVSVDDFDTGKSLYFKCTGAAVAIFKEYWEDIKTGFPFARKVKFSKKYNNRASFPSHEIKLNWSKDKIDRHVRALTFPPFQRPYFIINGKKFEIHYV